jgi:hypothetical protein
VTLPSDPVEALKWAFSHSGDAWWIIGAIAGGIAWTSKRLGDWNRRNALAVRAGANKAAAAAMPAAAPAPPYQASSYAAPAAYTAPPAAAPSPAASAPRRFDRDPAPVRRAATPFARSVDVPVPTGSWTVGAAFGDPASARTAVIVAEILGPPVGLR